jgi:hypothetical protein
MARLNVTLDRHTYAELERQAKQLKKPCARVAKEILAEGLVRRTAAKRREKLAADYRAGRADARAILKDLEAPQWGLMDDEEA